MAKPVFSQFTSKSLLYTIFSSFGQKKSSLQKNSMFLVLKCWAKSSHRGGGREGRMETEDVAASTITLID